MPSRFALGVMARAPVAGETKTRLIPMLGAIGAAQLQRELTLQALQTAIATAPQAVTLFTAGDAQHLFWAECADRLKIPLVAQRGAHLGERMRHALECLLRGHDSAVLIGTDCPALQRGHLTELRDRLQHARMAFIPAEDGGYVAVGARTLVAAAFGHLDWGTAEVMTQTRAALAAAGCKAGLDWVELPALWDIDRPEDLRRARMKGLLPDSAR